MSLPDFIVQRNAFFDELKKKHDEEMSVKERPEIEVVLDLSTNGIPEKKLVGKAWESTPGSFLRHVDKAISADVVVAQVNGELWDLDRPLEHSCRVAYVPFTADAGRKVFWHSSAHTLGEAAECHYNCQLSHGPPVDQGFFYDMALPEGQTVTQADWSPLESRTSKIFKEKQPFERLHVSLEDLRKMFGYSKYKMHYIDNLLPPEGSTVYKCGSLVDLCLGPHIQNTGKIKAFQIMKVSSDFTCLSLLILKGYARIHPATSWVIKRAIPCSASMVLHSQTKSRWSNIRSFSKKLPREITGKLALTRNCSSLMRYRRDVPSYCRTERSSSMHFKN
jgi:threonyl-tRNA synthetase